MTARRNNNGTGSRGRTSDSTLHVIHRATTRVTSIAKVVATIRSTIHGKGGVGHERGTVAHVASKDALTRSRSRTRSRGGGHKVGRIGQTASTGHDNGRGKVGATHGTSNVRCTAALEDVIAIVVAAIRTTRRDHGLILDQSGTVLGILSHGTLRGGTRSGRPRRSGRESRRIRETASGRNRNGYWLGVAVHRATSGGNGATSCKLSIAVVVTRVRTARCDRGLVLDQCRTVICVSSKNALLSLC